MRTANSLAQEHKSAQEKLADIFNPVAIGADMLLGVGFQAVINKAVMGVFNPTASQVNFANAQAQLLKPVEPETPSPGSPKEHSVELQKPVESSKSTTTLKPPDTREPITVTVDKKTYTFNNPNDVWKIKGTTKGNNHNF